MAESHTEQEIAELRKVFLIFDKDNDGNITLTELESALKELGQNYTEGEMVDIFNKAKKEGADSIDFPAFLDFMAHRPQNKEEEILEAFRHFDQDGNGFLSADEIRTGKI